MKLQRNLRTAALLISCMGSAFATENATLTVTGTIKPSACTPHFEGGGIIDYGTIQASTLAAETAHALETKDLYFTIVCATPMRVSFKAIDNRIGTAEPNGAFKILSNTGKPIGNYSVFQYKNHHTEKGSAGGLFSQDNKDWNVVGNPNGLGFNQNTVRHGYFYTLSDSPSNSASTLPGTYTQHRYGWDVRAVINLKGHDLTKEITLDGSTTFELNYF